MSYNDIIKKHGSNSINEFWSFVERLNFNSATADAEAVRLTLLKQISPGAAERYKTICDDLAYDLFNRVPSSEKSLLYATYDVIAQGREHYEQCVQKPDVVVVASKATHALNHLGNVFPTEDDYYARLVGQETVYTIDDYDA